MRSNHAHSTPQRLLVNDIHLGVIQYGEQNKPDQTLVLLHGFTGSASGWAELLPGLATPGRRVIAFDLPGHGLADAPPDPARYSIEHCQDDLRAALSILGVRPREAILLGYSMGGRIALSAALSGFFRALILESASPGLADPVERERRRQSDNALAERLERAGIAAFVAYWEKLQIFASQSRLPAETQQALRAQRLNNRADGLANSLRGVGTGVQPAFHERLGELDLPVLLLAGELDEKFCDIARHMARALPRASLRIIPAAGHAVHLEQPAAFIGHVNAFCDTL